jgi:hypothetical protein
MQDGRRGRCKIDWYSVPKILYSTRGSPAHLLIQVLLESCTKTVPKPYPVDRFTRRVVGFAVRGGVVDGAALCRMFNRAIRGQTTPNYVSTDKDPLYRFPPWQANLRVLEVTEIKTVPYVPLSHPFVERLIGTLRQECLDRTLFWTAADLDGKLLEIPRLL